MCLSLWPLGDLERDEHHVGLRLRSGGPDAVYIYMPSPV